MQGAGARVNILLDPDPHPLGMYGLLQDGRRAVNLIWAHEIDPRGRWLEWPGPRHRDHFATCPGGPGLHSPHTLAASAVETIGEVLSRPDSRRTGVRSRRLRDWP